MSRFRRFADTFIPLLFIIYGILFFIDPERYLPTYTPLVGTLIGGFMVGIGLWVYMRNDDDK